MPQNKKIIINISLLIILIIITFLLIFKDYDFMNTINIMLKANIKYIILAILSMLTYLLLESINVRLTLKSLGNKISLPKIYKCTFIEFFFSGITPGGSGGQPMEIYYMTKEGIPGTSSALALLLELCSFHIVTIVLGLISLAMNYNLILGGFVWIFIIGFTLKTIVLVIMLICLFSKKASNILLRFIISVLRFFKYSKIDEATTKLIVTLDTYSNGAKFIKANMTIFLRSLCLVTLKMITYFSITYFVYQSFGLNTYNYIDIISIQALLLVTVSSIPLPGTVGISETVFLNLNEKIFTMEYLPSGLLLSRGINFYLFMFISLIIVIINTIYIRIKNNRLE